MQRFKKRIRLLAEKLNGTVEYDGDDLIRVSFKAGSVTFTSKSFNVMECRVDLGDAHRTFPLQKSLVFDIIDRLASPHLAKTLRSYPAPLPITLDEYIRDESGGPQLQALRQEIEANPSLAHKDLGGNRFLAEYFHGVLILRDDLVSAATNVIEFGVSSPEIK